MRLEEPDEGRVHWDGDVRLSVLFPQDGLLSVLSVGCRGGRDRQHRPVQRPLDISVTITHSA